MKASRLKRAALLCLVAALAVGTVYAYHARPILLVKYPLTDGSYYVDPLAHSPGTHNLPPIDGSRPVRYTYDNRWVVLAGSATLLAATFYALSLWRNHRTKSASKHPAQRSPH